MQVREAIVRAFLKIKAKDFIHLDHIYDEVKLIRPASTRESVRARLQEWSKRHGAMRLDIGKRQHYQGPPDLFTSLMSEGGRNGYWKLNNNKDVEIGSYPFFRLGKIGVSVVSRSTSKEKLKNVNKDLIKIIKYKKIKILNI